jgi:hypothetical protein
MGQGFRDTHDRAEAGVAASVSKVLARLRYREVHAVGALPLAGPAPVEPL